MVNIKEKAENYEPTETKTVADLEVVRVDAEVKETETADKDGKPYKYSYIVVENEEYRVPNSVLATLKEIIAEKPNLVTFKVTKKGDGFNTKYTVITLSEKGE